MKIAIAAPSAVPFVLGGAERLWDGLARYLNDHTRHDAEIIKLPSPEENLPDLIDGYRRFSRLDLSHFDVVISGKYPAWMVSHPNHVIYMAHKLRGLYDTYHYFGLPQQADHGEAGLAGLQTLLRSGRRDDDAAAEAFALFDQAIAALGRLHPAFDHPSPLGRELIHFLDDVALRRDRIQRYCAISRTVATRPGYFPSGVPVHAVHPPSDLRGLRPGRSDYFFTASRLDGPKRITLLVHAMKHVDADIPLVIAGAGPDEDRLREISAADPRIQFLGRISETELASRYADARAVPFVPLDEDLGLITLEAMTCAKPVVTCRDSGGPTEFVEDGRNGFVVAPEPEAIGRALQRLAAEPGRAEEMGAAARLTAAAVTWERVAATVIGFSPRSRTRPPARRDHLPKVVIASTYPVFPPQHGGQIRASRLAQALTDHFDVEIVSLTTTGAAAARRAVAPGLTEATVPQSPAHALAEQELSRSVGWVPVTDLAATLFDRRTPALEEALAEAAAGAAGAVLSHPFLLPALARAAPELTLIYDAHNVEARQKADVLPADASGRRLLELAERVEGTAARKAVAVSACSEADAGALAGRYGIDPARITVVPNGVDCTAIGFVALPRRRELAARWLATFGRLGRARVRPRHLALFVGSWHPPNLEAAERIMAYAPRLPHVSFVLAGSHAERYRRWRLPDNVIALGRMSDGAKRRLLAAAEVALNPMAAGSGSNLKLAEYMAAGTPVISTAFGARGYAVRPSQHYLEAELNEFPTAILELLGDSRLAAGLAEEGRGLVERDYDWNRIGTGYVAMVRRALQAHGAGGDSG